MAYVFNPFTGNLDTTDVVAFNGEVNAGTQGSPSLFFTGDPDTGIYSPGADQLAISTGGSERLRITSTGQLSFIGAGSSGSPAVGFNGSAPSNSLVIDSTGRLGIGTTSPGQPLTVAGANPQIGLPDGAGNTATIGVAQGGGGIGNLIITGIASKNITFNSPSSEFARIDSSGRLLVGTSSWLGGYSRQIITGNTASATGPGVLYLSRGSSNPGVGLTLGELKFSDSNGSIGASIVAWSDSAWAADDYPSYLVFSTTADGASSPTERMRIKSSGIINFANAPTYASDTAAGAGGLVTGDVYKTADGSGGFNLKIKA